MPYSLCWLFATILALSCPNEPRKLWDQFKEFMFEDYVRDEMDLKDAELKALEFINSLLEPIGKNVNDYELINYDVTLREEEKLGKIMEEELRIIISDMDLSCANNLNKEQKFAYDMILEKVFAGEGAMVFIDGPGETGKTD